MKRILSVLIGVFFYSALISQPGILDSSFGTDGKVNVGGPSIAIQTDGKILVVNPGGSQISVTRINKNGKTDRTFGNNGTASMIFDGLAWSESAQRVAVKQDGKIIVAGSVYNGDLQETFLCLASFNTNGSPDSSFGTNGQVETQIGEYTGAASGIVIQSDGKFDVSIIRNEFAYSRTAAIRFNADGTEDKEFEISFSVHDLCNAIGIQSDGKIVLTGNTNKDPFGDEFDLFRFNSTGLLDKTFGKKGVTSLHYLQGMDLTVRPNDKIIAITEDSILIQFQQDGIIDSSFGRNGRVHLSFKCNSVAIQVDGKIIVAGKVTNGSNNDFAVARYLVNGKQDKNFGSSGITTTDFYLYDEALDIAIQTDNKIVVSGSAGTARYKAGPVASSEEISSDVNAFTNISLQPNPTYNIITITGLNSPVKKIIEIADANGLVVFRQITNDNSLRCNVSPLHQGTYYVFINQNGEVIKRSFIKE